MSARILIVDDEQLVLDSLSTLLRFKGYDVATALSGREALQAVDKGSADLLIVDVRMPGMGGMDLLAGIREKESASPQGTRHPVIVLTGYADEDVPIKAMRLKADDFIQKPFESDQVLYSVERCVRLWELEKQKADHARLLEEKVREAEERVAKTERLAVLGEIASMVAHELRNPLTSFNNVIQYVRDSLKDSAVTREDPELLKMLSLGEKEVQNAIKILADLLDWTGAFRLSITPVNLNVVIQQARQVVSVPEKVSIGEEFQDALPTVEGDFLRLRQIFINLISNAVQAMPDGGRITLRTRSETIDGKTMVTAEVEDTGRGISDDNLPRIFEPLFTTQANGTGLGLAISRNIATKHGGFLTVSNKLDRGARFILQLPAAEPR